MPNAGAARNVLEDQCGVLWDSLEGGNPAERV